MLTLQLVTHLFNALEVHLGLGVSGVDAGQGNGATGQIPALGRVFTLEPHARLDFLL